MTLFANLDPFWAHSLSGVIILTGIALVWRGLRGGRNGERALLRRETAMRSRIEGFRLMMFGLVLLGIGLAIIWQAQWLLVLALGIGFVEILESSALIAFWKGDRRNAASNSSSCRKMADSPSTIDTSAAA